MRGITQEGAQVFENQQPDGMRQVEEEAVNDGVKKDRRRRRRLVASSLNPAVAPAVRSRATTAAVR